jgi:3-hydroxyisobutyrate dehydrogenase-like beta-hydroxyacid dehydrogenase
VPSLEELVTPSEIVISAVHGNVALDIARDAAVYIKPDAIFADLNNATPSAKKQAAEVINARGARFVDVGLFEPPAHAGHKVLMYVSGDGSEQFKNIMSKYGLIIEALQGEPHKATIIKTLANIYMKGVQAVCLEAAMSAHKAGINLDLLGSLVNRPVKNLPKEKELAFWAIRGAQSAARKTAELRDIVTVMKEWGIEPVMMEAAIGRLSLIAEYGVKEYLDDDVSLDDYNAIARAFDYALHEKGVDLQ